MVVQLTFSLRAYSAYIYMYQRCDEDQIGVGIFKIERVIRKLQWFFWGSTEREWTIIE